MRQSLGHMAKEGTEALSGHRGCADLLTYN
jgi:hypothetical protein